MGQYDHHSQGNENGAMRWLKGAESQKLTKEKKLKNTEPEQSKARLEHIVELINENFDDFTESVEGIIDTLYKKDFTKNAESGSQDDQVAMKDATDGIQAINAYIDILKTQMDKDEGTELQIEALAQQRDRLSDAIVGYTYRMSHQLESGEQQVNELISQVANGTLPKSDRSTFGYEKNPDYLNQKKRFKEQPDIADRYAGLAQIDQIITRIFSENKFSNEDGTKVASFSDIANFVDGLTALGDINKWSEEDNRKARLLIEPLQQLFDVPVFGEKAREKFDALKQALEGEAIKKTFIEKGLTDPEGNVYDLDFVLKQIDRLSTEIDAYKFTDEQVTNYQSIIQTLKELSDLPISGEKIKQSFDALRARIQQTIEKGLKTYRAAELLAQGKEMLKSIPASDKEFRDVVDYLEELFSEKSTAENKGWVVLGKDDAQEFIDTIKKDKEKIITRWGLRFKPETSAERLPKIEFCQAVEDFAREYSKKQVKLARLLPIINELQIVNTFGKKEEPAKAVETSAETAA